MRQLTSLDAQFLALENSRQFGHVGGLALLDPSDRPDGTLTLADITQLIGERLHLAPPLRWRLAEVPLGLDYPYWVEDPEFDLEFHVREVALPAPGTPQQLAEQVARIASRPLDRSRPLWEMYVISGLASGQVALLTKIHHAVIDGVSGAEIMGLLYDLTPEGRPVDPPQQFRPPRAPSTLGMVARGLLGLPRYPLRALRSLPSAVPHLEETSFAALPGVPELSRVVSLAEQLVRWNGDRVDAPTLRSPKTSFSAKVSSHRRFTFGQLPLDRVKTVKKAFDCTVNDVVVSICAGAVRRWLVEHEELPESPLVVQVPVSVRTRKQAGTYGNRILLLGAPLYTDEPDPVTRLQRTSTALDVLKERHKALPAALLQDTNHFIPPALFNRAARLAFAVNTSFLGRPTWNLCVSNVPGPQFPLYIAGARLDANYPVSVITDGMGLNITLMSYNGHIDIGIVADRDQMPDLAELVPWLDEELTLLEKAAL